MSGDTTEHSPTLLQRALGALFRFLASLKLAVPLLLTLAAVLAVATILETNHGAEYANWFVYKSPWFCALLALLGVNIFCAAAIRFPWKRHQTGFVVTHAGLLVLLAGSVQTFVGGLEGQVSLVEGEQTSELLVPRRGRITASWVARPQEAPYEFTFEGGPVAWPAGQTFDVGEVDGVGARILNFYPRAKSVTQWVEDDSGEGRPVVHFKLAGPDGKVLATHWLADEAFGDELFVGPLLLRLQHADTDRMLDDFSEPPTEDLGEQGMVLMYYGDAVERVEVADNKEQEIPLGTTGVTVQIAEYLPNAHPDKLGRFTSEGDQPANPMLELRVCLPGEKEPLRQIAFAKSPLLNLDGIYGRVCPVKFVYHHPAVKPPPSIEFLQTSDGTLHARQCVGGRYTSCGEVATGDCIDVAGGFELSVERHLSHGRRDVTFEPAAGPQDDKERTEPAALVEIRVGDVTRQAWLQRNDPEHGQTTIKTPEGSLRLAYDYGSVPLGFSLKLLDFRRDANPGGVGNAAFSSRVHVVAENRELDAERRISMNEPLTEGRFTLYQSGFNDAGHGQEASTFSVAYDPGRSLKYLGSLMICAGIVIMSYMRAYFFKRQPRSSAAASVTIVGDRRADHREPATSAPQMYSVRKETAREILAAGRDGHSRRNEEDDATAQ